MLKPISIDRETQDYYEKILDNMATYIHDNPIRDFLAVTITKEGDTIVWGDVGPGVELPDILGLLETVKLGIWDKMTSE